MVLHGIGTITYYEPRTKKFATLGHGIVDSDTNSLIKIASGELVTTYINSIVKGEKGKIGEIKGSIVNSKAIGVLSSNTEFGVYGELKNMSALNVDTSNEMEVAFRNEIKLGPAKMILNIEDNIRKEYDIEITRIYRNNNSDNKSMLIRVTDEELLELTGGIIQGMSGAPIVQNGKFVGAVTHVLVNNPAERICSFWRLNDKTVERNKIKLNYVILFFSFIDFKVTLWYYFHI